MILWPNERTVASVRSKRGVIKDASASSLRLLAFLLANSYAEWVVMITLTFRVEHEDPKGCLKEWQSQMCWHNTKEFNYAWFMEFQRRGVVHFHYFLGSDAFAEHMDLFREEWKTFYRGKPARPVEVLRGNAEYSIVSRWISCVGDTSPAFAAVQSGGIIERLRSSEAAGRYAARYAGKKEQKELPEGQEPLGRWWYISQKATPHPESESNLIVYPHDRPFTLLWDGSVIKTEDDLRKHESETNQSRYCLQG